MEPETVLWCVFPPRTLGTQAVYPPRHEEQGVCSPACARLRIGTERTEWGPLHVYTFGGWFIFLNCPMSRADNKKACPVSSSALVEKKNIYIYI